MSEATPLHVVTTLNPDGTVGDRVTFVASIDDGTAGAYRMVTERQLGGPGAAPIASAINPVVAKEIESRPGGTPDHFTITILPDGHLNHSMGLVLMVERPAPVGPYRADIEIPLSDEEVAAIDPLYSAAFAAILSEAGHTLAPEPEPASPDAGEPSPRG